MVTHQTASPITAKARGRSAARTVGSRSVVSLMAMIDHSRAVASPADSPIAVRFHATRQRAEQNLACSRRGSNTVPHCAQVRVSVITLRYAGCGRAAYAARLIRMFPPAGGVLPAG